MIREVALEQVAALDLVRRGWALDPSGFWTSGMRGGTNKRYGEGCCWWWPLYGEGWGTLGGPGAQWWAASVGLLPSPWQLDGLLCALSSEDREEHTGVQTGVGKEGLWSPLPGRAGKSLCETRVNLRRGRGSARTQKVGTGAADSPNTPEGTRRLSLGTQGGGRWGILSFKDE